MRTVPASRNRLALALAGLVALLAAAALAAVPLDATSLRPGLAVLLPEAGTTLAQIARAHRTWLLPGAVAASVLLAVLGALLLIGQIPTRPAAVRRRLTDEDGTLLASYPADVLDAALAEQLERVPGVRSAVVRVGGPATAPWTQARLVLDEDAPAASAATIARGRLAEDLRTALEAEPARVDLLLALRAPGRPGRRSAAVRSVPADGIGLA